MSASVTYVLLTGDPETDALLFGTRWDSGSGVVLTYSFPGNLSQWDAGYSTPGEPNQGFAPLAASEQQAVRSALQAWSSVANLSFSEVADDASGAGTLRFGYTTWGMGSNQLAYTYAPTESANGGDVWLNAALKGSLFSSLAPGTLGNYVLLHEVGHALGFKHPHEASEFSAATLNTFEDSVFNSVMSYNAWPGVALTQTNIDRLPSTPMSFDIDALQALYGANTTAHAGDDLYVFQSDGRYLETLYDTGGNDTIQLVSNSTGGEIDLRPDEWSRLGSPVQINGGAIQSPDTVEIYHTTTIENAIGGDGNDTLIGNDGANRLTGNGGNDTLIGGAGSDTLQGGTGSDTFVLDAGSLDTVTGFSAGDGDKLDLSHLVALFHTLSPGSDPFAAGYLRMVQQSQDTVLEYDTDGTGTQDTWHSIVALIKTNATGITSANFTQGNLDATSTDYLATAADILSLNFTSDNGSATRPPSLSFALSLSSAFSNTRSLQILFWPVNEAQTYVTLSRSDGSQPFIADVTLSSFARSGPYEIRAIDVTDNTGTQLRITREDLIDRSLDYFTELLNPNADNQDPVLQSFDFGIPSTAADGSIHIPVEVSASDDLSGLQGSRFDVFIVSPTGATLDVLGNFDSSGHATVDVRLEPYSPSGEYGIQSVRLTDLAGNLSYSEDWLQTHLSTITIVNPNGDTVAPLLQQFTLGAAFDPLTDRPKIVINGLASDAQSGLDVVFARFSSPPPSNAFHDIYVYDHRFSTEQNNTVNLDASLPLTTDFLPGEYGVSYVEVRDLAGNVTRLSNSDLAASHLANSINIFFR